MEEAFITYQKFNDPALADDLTNVLDKHDIPYLVEEESFSIEATMVLNNPLTKELAVKLKSSDFDKVNQLLQNEAQVEIEEVDKDYYLFSFSDMELLDLISKADEWSPFDFMLARKILAQKGNVLSNEEVKYLKDERINELKKPEGSQKLWVIIGYICALIGGILGIFIGWHLLNHKKTLPNGDRVYNYSETDRKHGRVIFYISSIMWGAFIIFKLLGVFKS
jgi:hypothetical protein